MANLSSGCRKSGRCTCIHVYEDGLPVPGSGSADDPYIHERPPVRCVAKYNGQRLAIDEDGCVILPNHITSVVLDGQVISPDLQGRVQLPSDLNLNLTSFHFRDADDNVLTVTEGSEVHFRMDGEVGLGQLDLETPAVLGNSIVLPQMKVRTYRIDFDQSQIGTPGIGGIPLNVSEGVSVPLTTLQLSQKKATQYTLHLSIGIQESSTQGAAATAEFITFKPVITTTAPGIVEHQEFPSLIWSPDNGFGHKRYTVSTSLKTLAPLTSGQTATLSLRKVSSSNLAPGRDVRCEFQAFLVSV